MRIVKLGGHFIGTCYDGATIFEALEDKDKGDAIAAYYDEKKMWEIKKDYSSADFENNETSVGYPIEVFQESINKAFKEYLVNFTYLRYLLENYGFELITHEEAQSMGLPNGTGLFDELFSLMEQEISRGSLKKADVGTAEQMTPEEKQVSFYNRYFVFKKIKHIEADKVLRVMTQTSGAEPKSSLSTKRPIRKKLKNCIDE